MTTNDATPRDAIAKVIFGDEWLFDPNDKMYTAMRSVGLRHGALEQADDMIAHLWQAADDPTVMREVASAISQIPFTVLDPRITARTAAAALLSALLGPRPQESDDGQ